MAAERELALKITGDAKGLSRAFGRAEKDTGRLSGSVKRLGGVMGKALAAGGVAAAAGVAAGVKAFADFDQQMQKSIAIMGDVSDEMRDTMSDQARQVAKDLGMSAADAAESYFFLASAGMDAAQATEALPQVAKFAKAGMFDMATATDLATDAQSALGLTSDDAAKNLKQLTRVTDVFAKSNSLANTSVEQIATAFTNKFGAALRVMNKDVEEGAAVLAVLADAGVKGEKAGQMATTGMQMLTRQAAASKDAFAEMNLEVLDSDGNLRNMADVTEELTREFGGLSDAERALAMQKLGLNKQAADFVNQILGSSDAMREYEDSLNDASGATEDIAQKQMQTFSEQMKRIRAIAIDWAISIGERVVPVLEKLAAFIDDKVVPAVERFAKHMGEKLRPVFNVFETGARAVWGVLSDIGSAFVDAFGAARDAWKSSEEIRGGFEMIGRTGLAVAGYVDMAARPFKRLGFAARDAADAFAPAMSRIREVAAKVFGAIADAGLKIAFFLRENWDQIVSGVAAAVDSIVARWQQVAEIVLPVIRSWVDQIVDFIGGMVDMLSRHWDRIVAAVTDAFRRVAELADYFVTGIWGEIEPKLRPIFQALIRLVDVSVDRILTIWEKWGSKIFEVLRQVFDAFLPVVRPALDTLQSVIETVTAVIEGDWSAVWEGLKDILRNALRTFVEIIKAQGRVLLAAMQWVGGKLLDGLKGTPGLMVDAGKAIITGLIDGIQASPGALKDAIMDLVPTPGEIIDAMFGGGGGDSSLTAPSARGLRGASGALLPGTYRGKDTMVAAVAPGEAILTPKQQGMVETGVPIRQAIAMTGGRLGGTGFAAGGFVQPVRNGSWSGGPDAHRARPLGNWQSDDAWDIFPRGDDRVYAAFRGTISRISPFSSNPQTWGYGVYLSGAGGQLFYKHLKSVGVRSGQTVGAGTPLGTLGDGVNGGKHLHLGANPVSLLKVIRSGGDPGTGVGGARDIVAQRLRAARGGGRDGAGRGASAPPLNDRQKLARTLGMATGRSGLGKGRSIADWAKPLVNTLSSDVPDVSSNTTGTNFTGAQQRAISGAARKARASARADGKSPQEVREEGERAEREAELLVLRRMRRQAIQRRAGLQKQKARFLRAWKKLSRRPVRGRRAVIARRKATAQIKAKLREFTAEINDMTEIIAEVNERMAMLNEQAIEEEHAANYEDTTGDDAGAGAGGGVDAPPEPPSEAESLQTNMAMARLTEGTADDLQVARNQLDFAEREFAAARASGDVRRIGQAASALRSARDTVASMTPGESDFLELQRVAAQFTEGTGDDLAAAKALEAFRLREVQKAQAAGDPRAYAAALSALLSAQQSRKAIEENTDAMRDNTDALRGFAGSTTFQFRGQDYVLRSLAPPSSDSITNLAVGA